VAVHALADGVTADGTLPRKLFDGQNDDEIASIAHSDVIRGADVRMIEAGDEFTGSSAQPLEGSQTRIVRGVMRSGQPSIE
jgi:hypothetical protein